VAFLTFLQVMAAVLNLIPLPPFDGYGALAPFLNHDLRMRINQNATLIMLVVFFALWSLPFVNNALWDFVGWLANLMGIPLYLASIGFSQFQFWRK